MSHGPIHFLFYRYVCASCLGAKRKYHIFSCRAPYVHCRTPVSFLSEPECPMKNSQHPTLPLSTCMVQTNYESTKNLREQALGPKHKYWYIARANLRQVWATVQCFPSCRAEESRNLVLSRAPHLHRMEKIVGASTTILSSFPHFCPWRTLLVILLVLLFISSLPSVEHVYLLQVSDL